MRFIIRLLGLFLFAALVASAAVSFRPFSAQGAEIAPNIQEAVIDDEGVIFVLEHWTIHGGKYRTMNVVHNPDHEWREDGRTTIICWALDDLLAVVEPTDPQRMQAVLAMRVQADRCLYNPEGYPVMMVKVLTKIEGEGQRPTLEVLLVEGARGQRAYTWRVVEGNSA